MSELLLQASQISKRFGGLTALDHVHLELGPGQIHALIGPNGAGKSTLFNCISGTSRPDTGSVVVNGENLTGKPAHVYAARGVQRTYQHARPFVGLTLAENVMVGAHSWTKAGALRGSLKLPPARREERELRVFSSRLLEEMHLGGREEEEAGSLTLAEERRLEIARCLAGRPTVLLLDEPAAGLGEREASELGAAIQRLREDRGISIVLVEHHLEMALALADVVTVLNFGRVIAHDTPAEVRRHPQVIEAYIGSAA